MIKEAIEKIVDKQDLTYDEAYTVMNEIMSGETTQTQNAAFLAALSTKSTKSETIDEISGCAAAMREHALRLVTDYPTMEIVGTGGDRSGTINISTTAAFIMAAAGIKVSKHGNRAASSKSGAADCLEALGADLQADEIKDKKLLDETGFCFMFAQKYHSSMKYVGAIRRELGFRTVFNILGPLTNPAFPKYMMLGVYDESLVQPLAKVLSALGVEHGMVVYGTDKMDEISLSAPTSICEFHNGEYTSYVLSPEPFGLKRCKKEDVIGGTGEENAEITRQILKGELTGPKRDIVVLNAGAGIYIGGKAKNLQQGIDIAQELIDNGKAYETLEKFIALSKEN